MEIEGHTRRSCEVRESYCSYIIVSGFGRFEEGLGSKSFTIDENRSFEKWCMFLVIFDAGILWVSPSVLLAEFVELTLVHCWLFSFNLSVFEEKEETSINRKGSLV